MSDFADMADILKKLYPADLKSTMQHASTRLRMSLGYWYTPTSTWVDGLIAAIIVDHLEPLYGHSRTDWEDEAKLSIWMVLRNKVDWRDAMRWSRAWFEAYGRYDYDPGVKW